MQRYAAICIVLIIAKHQPQTNISNCMRVSDVLHTFGTLFRAAFSKAEAVFGTHLKESIQMM